MANIYEPILEKELPFWNRLSAEEKSRLSAGTAHKLCPKGSLVHSASEKCMGVILVRTGQLRVYMESEEGRDITLYRLEPGAACTLSASCFMQEITFEVLIDAEQDSEILVLNSGVFKQISAQNVYAENYLYRQTVSRFSDVMWAMQQILFLSFDKRLALFLLEEQKKSGSSTVAMTHEQIAKYVGSAREVVSRMLKYFEEEGYVGLSRGKIVILDEAALDELINK